ncbi:universal stress protein [Streptomyces virginiae]|uniref:universal stress protein n=1 Tax=Streptomyces virginiae TaxID=1961 RepID=UPI002E2B418A|nr:universal stress protein [Streptomyces virginiae]
MEGTIRHPDVSSVIVGVDGSDSARTAAMWAAAEAVRRDRPLHIVYGADTDGRTLYLSAETVEQVRHAVVDCSTKRLRRSGPNFRARTSPRNSAEVIR